jgi:hypothetical protein
VRIRALAALAAALAWTAAALVWPAPAWAALDTGTLDVRGAAGPARLRAVDFAWVVELEPREGRALFLDVPPGRYELLLDGGEPARTLVMHAARTVVLDVSGRGEGDGLLAVEDDAEGTSFGASWLRDLPTSRDAWSLLETTEPVAIADRMDTGGVWAGTPGRVAAHGTSLAQSRTVVGGADVTDALGRGFALADPDLTWLSSVRFTTSLLPASESSAGPVLSLSPLRPGANWTATGTLDFAQPETAPTGGPPPIAQLHSWLNGAVLAAGPLGRGGLVVGASLREAERFERGQPLLLDTLVRSAVGQLTLQPTERQHLRLFALGQWVERPFVSRHAARSPAAREQSSAALWSADWTTRRADGSAVRAAVSYAHQSVDRTNVELGATVERLLDGPVLQIVRPGAADEGRWSARLEADRPLDALGKAGRVRAGLWFERASADDVSTRAGWGIPERLDGIGARWWRLWHGSLPTRWASNDLAGWAEVHTDPARRVSARAGVRVESLRASKTNGDEVVDWLTLSPRLRLRWRLSGRTALLLGGGQYRHRLPLSQVAFGDRSAPYAEAYRWDDRDADGLFREAELGPPVTQFGPGVGLASVDPELRAPLTREVVLGVERRAGPWTARFVGLYRRETRLIETVNVGVTEAEYVRFTVPDPSGDLIGPEDDQLLPVYARRPTRSGPFDSYLLTNVTGDDAWHEGAEITVMRDGERLGLLLGATAHRSDGPNAWRGFRPDENDQGLVGERRDNPNADTFARGRLFSDRAYSIKIAARYAAPGDVRLGAVARYQDGQPFARLVIVRDLPQGAEAIQAIPNGRHRFEFAITVDARVEKGFRLGRARLAAVAEAFNLLGNAHEVEEDVVTGPAFRTPTADQPPRVWRFGLRVDLP